VLDRSAVPSQQSKTNKFQIQERTSSFGRRGSDSVDIMRVDQHSGRIVSTANPAGSAGELKSGVIIDNLKKDAGGRVSVISTRMMF
jgi:hypothetical protein